jgi:hypothetical protein
VRVETRLTGKVLNASVGERGRVLSAALLKAESESAAAMKARAQVPFSSGTVSTATQKQIARQINNKKGLYSKASPVSLNQVINQQTGFFYNHWQARLAWSDDGTRITLFNNAAYAKYLLGGTRYMVARPISLRVAEIEQPARLRRLQAALRSAYK